MTQTRQKVMLHEMIEHCFKWLQHCSNMAALCCAKNRHCESFHATSPKDGLKAQTL